MRYLPKLGSAWSSPKLIQKNLAQAWSKILPPYSTQTLDYINYILINLADVKVSFGERN